MVDSAYLRGLTERETGILFALMPQNHQTLLESLFSDMMAAVKEELPAEVFGITLDCAYVPATTTTKVAVDAVAQEEVPPSTFVDDDNACDPPPIDARESEDLINPTTGLVDDETSLQPLASTTLVAIGDSEDELFLDVDGSEDGQPTVPGAAKKKKKKKKKRKKAARPAEQTTPTPKQRTIDPDDLAQIAALDLWLSKGAKLSRKQAMHSDFLIQAAMVGHEEAVKVLLEKPGIRVLKEMMCNNKHHGVMTALHVAAVRGNLNIVQLLLSKPDIQINRMASKHTPLTIAVECGHIEVVKILIKAGADLEAGHGGYNPLALACMCSEYEVAKLLLDAGALTTGFFKGQTPLSLVARKNDAKLVQILAEGGADVEPKFENRTPLFEAVENGSVLATKALLDAGANTEVLCSARNDILETGSEVTALILACIFGHVDIAKLLLAAGADMDPKNCGTNTALWTAMQTRNIEMVKLLVDAGVDVEVPCFSEQDIDGLDCPSFSLNGFRPLFLSCLCGYADIARTLLEAGADQNVAEPEELLASVYSEEDAKTCEASPLFVAIQKCHLQTVIALLAHGVDLEAMHDGRNALCLACDLYFADCDMLDDFAGDRYDVIKSLLKAGADTEVLVQYNRACAARNHVCGETNLQCNETTLHGKMTALNIAVAKALSLNATSVKNEAADQQNATSIIKLLIEFGANPNTRSSEGDTPLSSVCREEDDQYYKIVQILVDQGADVHAGLTCAESDQDSDYDEIPPIFFAASGGAVKIIRILAAAGADMEYSTRSGDDAGKSMLFIACENGNVEVAKALVEVGADVDTACCGKSALFAACEKNRHEGMLVVGLCIIGLDAVGHVW